MHTNTKLTQVMRREIYQKWVRGRGSVSLRVLAAEYHVDKRVIGRIIERGGRGEGPRREGRDRVGALRPRDRGCEARVEG